MENKRVVPIWVSIILIILCILSLGACIQLLSLNLGPWSIVNVIILIIASILAVVYCFMGFSKKAGQIFTIFSGLLGLAGLFDLITKSTYLKISASATDLAGNILPVTQDSEGLYDLSLFFAIVVFVLFAILTVVKDLGKKKSFILLAVAAVISLVEVIFSLILGSASGVSVITSVILNVETYIFFLSLIYGVMIYAKYRDKEARGSK